MILILSTESGERTTEEVMSWINHFGYPVTRLNGGDLLSSCSGTFRFGGKSSDDLTIDSLDLSTVKCTWARRWGAPLIYNPDMGDAVSSDSRFNRYYNSEFRSYSNAILKRIEPTLFNNYSSFPKLEQLKQANEVGLTVPETIVSTNRDHLIDFFKSTPGRVSQKSISELLTYNHRKLGMVATFTSIVNLRSLEEMPISLPVPLLMQHFIEKDVELRIFYLCGICYTMAIYSALDSKTSVDFRNYNNTNPNRFVPFLLPPHIEDKIVMFMNTSGYKCGSIDMILSTDKRYYFLEMNPGGQFGMVSFPCNYNLEKTLAEKLIEYAKEQ